MLCMAIYFANNDYMFMKFLITKIIFILIKECKFTEVWSLNFMTSKFFVCFVVGFFYCDRNNLILHRDK